MLTEYDWENPNIRYYSLGVLGTDERILVY
jgi:hypothetical protein